MTGSRPRVLVVGHTYVVGVNQAKWRPFADRNTATVGLLVPSVWKSRDWGKQFRLERSIDRLAFFPSEVWLPGFVGAHFYPPGDIRRAWREFSPDLVQVEQEVFSLAAFQVALCARRNGTPLVVLCAESVDRHLSLLRRRTRRFVLESARLIITAGREAAALVRKWGYGGRVEILPHLGVDPDLFAPPGKAPRNGCFTAGYLGRLAREKGIDVLLAAVQRLRDRNEHVRLVVCGAGPEETALRSLASKTGIDALISWRGGVPHHEVPEVLAGLNALVLPSRTTPVWTEQFGHVLIEAMSMALPAIGSRSGEIPNVLGRNDVIFPDGDADALAEVLARMIHDPGWREEIGVYNRARVQELFSHETVADRLSGLWNDVLNATEPRARPDAHH